MGYVHEKIQFFTICTATTLGLVGSAIQTYFPHQVLCLLQHAPFYPIFSSCISLTQSVETWGIGDDSVYYMSRHMLDRLWNELQSNYSGGLQGAAVSYMRITPFDNSSSCTSYVSGSVTMERGNGFDGYGSGLFHRYDTCGHAKRIVPHLGGWALMMCLPFDNVHHGF